MTDQDAKARARRDGERARSAAMARRSVLAGLGVGAGALLTGCAAPGGGAPQPQPQSQPEPSPGPATTAAEPAAPAPEPELTARETRFPLIIDTANRLNAGHAAGLAALGVQTVFRYYSYVPSNIRGKDLQPEETRILHQAGLSTAVVFQHYNNCFDAFANDWGARDAEQALRLAEVNGQPEGSAIYFGVDGDWPYLSLLNGALRYFERVAERFQASGVAVGAYGGGCILEQLRRRGLARYFWLSGSTGFTGTQAFYNSGAWTLFQNQLDVTPQSPRVGVDTNLCNPAAAGYFGQFSASGAQAAAHDPALTRQVIGQRRFLRRGADLLAAPGGAALASLRIRSNVRLLAEGEGWARVETQEGGTSRRGPSRIGFVRSADLAAMDQIPGGATSYGICGADQAAPSRVRNANCSAAARAFRS